MSITTYLGMQSPSLTGQSPFLTGLNHLACLYDWLGVGCLYCSNKHQSRLIYDNHYRPVKIDYCFAVVFGIQFCSVLALIIGYESLNKIYHVLSVYILTINLLTQMISPMALWQYLLMAGLYNAYRPLKHAIYILLYIYHILL